MVDDSSVVRRLVRVALEKDSAFEVAGVAANGKIALGMIERLRPDVLTLDIEMPEMNGLETLEKVRKLYPELRVVMFSNLTVTGAEYAFEALAQGADDYVAKPANVAAHQINVEQLGDELTAKIKNLFQTFEVPIEQIPRANVSAPKDGVAVVAIGVSTGGPNALGEIIPALPLELPCPVVVTQHMPATFTRLLANRLNSKSPLTVVEAEQDHPVEAGMVLIAPGGRHLCFRRRGKQIVVNLTDGPRENSCKPAVDVMFRSVCEMWGGSALAVILTGMGRDGLSGVGCLKQAGSTVLAQDQE